MPKACKTDVTLAIRSATRRFFLTLALRECQQKQRDAGAVLGNRGAASPAPGDLLRGLLGNRLMGGSLDLTVRGLPSGTRASAISVPGALFGFPLRPRKLHRAVAITP